MNSIKTKDITDKKIWETYVSTYSEANFLSSWNWGEFHKRLGKKVFYRGYFQADKLVGVCLVVLEKAKRGNYCTCAGGPLLDWQDKTLVSKWQEDLSLVAKQEGALFVRVRPQILGTLDNKTLFENLGFTASPMHLTADLTLQLDLDLSSDELLSQMRKNTRYDIRKAEKIGIIVKKSTDLSDLDQFYQDQLALAQKHGFVPFSQEFLSTQFEVFAADNQVVLFHAYHNNQLLASAFIIYYGNEAVYHYGTSTEANQKLPGSYALQWAAILEAQSRKMKRYNFWGIAPKETESQHRFAGVSMFKRGFGGQEVAYLPSHDLPVSSFYPLVKIFELFRAKRRNLI